MTIHIVRIRSATRCPSASARLRAPVTLLGLCWYLAGCSLQDFSELSKRGASSVGGAGQGDVGGTGAHQGGGGTNSGTSDSSGVTGGASSAGGLSNIGGSSSEGGASNTGGIASGGTAATTSTPTAIGGSDTTGCAFSQIGGQLLVPPSQGFEASLQGWTTTSQRTSALSRMLGNGANCEGDYYVTVDGAQRSANWDGAMLEVNSYVKVGHTYRYSVAVRQSPTGYAVPAQSFKLTISRTCASTVYDDILPQVAVQTDWVRMTKEFTLSLPADCTTAMSSVKLYVATYESAAPYVSFDLDDFKLIDLTPPTQGTGGASSVGGAPATGGTPGTGGTVAAGGAPSSGGATNTGGDSQMTTAGAGPDAG